MNKSASPPAVEFPILFRRTTGWFMLAVAAASTTALLVIDVHSWRQHAAEVRRLEEDHEQIQRAVEGSAISGSVRTNLEHGWAETLRFRGQPASDFAARHAENMSVAETGGAR